MSISFEVILATYNGELHLRKQLNSILSQIQNGVVIIHDDGSSDGTNKIISEYADKYKCIRVIKGPAQGNAKENFGFLLEKTSSPYVLFSDQDDIWENNKIERLIKMITFYEGVYGEEKPLLLHSDLSLINENDYEFSSSFWRYQNLNPEWGDDFNNLLAQNVVTGCTMIINRALINLTLPIPKEAIMHDYWLALTASGLGHIKYLDEALVKYRQHDSNVVGAKSFNLRYILYKTLQIVSQREIMRENQNQSSIQAWIFSHRYPESHVSKIALKYSRLPKMSKMRRIITISKNRFNKIGIVRNFAWYFLV
ncbi:glycosyltransferase family 2 protein [Deinococcus sp. SM5_A1]|uniref:glycosyltransferase family 2 protein n=1 Tax=Deinococcus sp. SM5_A1 TaxID=3379094 RepID=UPI003857F70E